MSVCLKLLSWTKYQIAKGGIKTPLLLEEVSMMTDIINISEEKVSDRQGVDDFRYPKETIIVDDRGYFDSKLFKTTIEDENHFTTRIKGNIVYGSVREYNLPENKDKNILKDKIIWLTGNAAIENGIKEVEFHLLTVYLEKDNRTVEWSAATISEQYKKMLVDRNLLQIDKVESKNQNLFGDKC